MAVSKIKRPGRVIEDSGLGGRYLLQLSSGYFYVRTANDGRPLAVRYPSTATHMAYSEADSLCQRFRSAGYAAAVVVDLFGRPVDFAALEEERRQQDERIARFWGE
jgi:hypothetical protein